MIRWLRLLALLGPVVALALLVGWRETELRGAAEWRIPVTGVDPLDQLRGRHLTVQLDWRLEGPVGDCTADGGCTLCLEQRAAAVVARADTPGRACPARLETRRSRLTVWPGVPEAATPGPAEGGPAAPAPAPPPGPPRFAATVFVPEARADAIDAALRDGQPTVLVARLTRSGRLVADRLEPAPRG